MSLTPEALVGDRDAAALARRLRVRRGGQRRQAAGQRGLHAAGHQHREHVATRGAALQRTEQALALFGADECVD